MRFLSPCLWFSWAIAAAVFGGCAKGPDPWSPKTYADELRVYYRAEEALGPGWKKYMIKGMEEEAFFFAREGLDAAITVHFTCGKYGDVPLSTLAGHLVIPMGREGEVIAEGPAEAGGKEAYHLLARGRYHYHKETLYREVGLVPDLYTELVLDAWLVREPNCVVDISYAASPEDYPRGLSDFHAYLEQAGIGDRTGTGERLEQAGGGAGG